MIGRGPNSCLLGHVTGPLFCLYVKLFLPSIFNSVDFWSSMSLIVLDIELTEKNIIKELGLFIDGSLQGFSFCPPKTFKPNKQTTWNTRHLHGLAWSIGKLDYEKLFAVFYDIKVMNAEVFAKGLEECRLLTRLLGQNVQKFGWLWLPKKSRSCQSRQFVDLLQLPLPTQNKTSLCREESKGVWRICYATFVNFVRVYCICVYY